MLASCMAISSAAVASHHFCQFFFAPNYLRIDWAELLPIFHQIVEKRLHMSDMIFIFDRSRDVATVTDFKAKSAKLADHTFIQSTGVT